MSSQLKRLEENYRIQKERVESLEQELDAGQEILDEIQDSIDSLVDDLVDY